MAYTTQAKVEQMFGITISGGGVSAIADIISAVKTWIDRYCGKTFEAASETRYYDGNGKSTIVIDGFTSITSLTILNSDGTDSATLVEGQGNGFITGPYNFTEKNELLLTGFGSYAKFPCRKHCIKVVGVFGGTTTVPADVQVVATRLAGQLFQEPNEGLINSVKLGDYSATYASFDEAADAMGLYKVLDQYRDLDI